MAGVCDICGGKTGFRNTFRCQDGVVCKNCYRIVSNNFTTTIARSSLADLKRIYIQNARPVDMGEEGFRTTKKVGTFLLLDEEGRKFCLLSNRNLTKEYARPEIHAYGDLEGYQLLSQPSFSAGELAALAQDKHSKAVVQKLSVRLRLKGGAVRDITVIPSPVRTSSFAFRQAYKALGEIVQALDGITR